MCSLGERLVFGITAVYVAYGCRRSVASSVAIIGDAAPVELSQAREKLARATRDTIDKADGV